MHFFSRQLSPGKWGIYSEDGLLATVSCQTTCDTIIANLKTGRRDVPKSELGELYRAPKLQKQSQPSTALTSPATSGRSKKSPSSAPKVRKLSVSREGAHLVTASTSQPTSHWSTTSASPSSAPPSAASAGTAAESQSQSSPKVSDLSNLQKRQIKIAQATRTSKKVTPAKKAERA